MILDNSSSCNAFREKIAESQALKTKAENQVCALTCCSDSLPCRANQVVYVETGCARQLAAILRETALLEEEAAHAEATHEKLKDPLSVAEEVAASPLLSSPLLSSVDLQARSGQQAHRRAGRRICQSAAAGRRGR